MYENLILYILTLIGSGWLSLLDYLAAHLLLWLVPAFIITGYISAMIPKETITHYLGLKASRCVGYPALSLQSILVTSNIQGRAKTTAYIARVTVFATLAGCIFGVAITII